MCVPLEMDEDPKRSGGGNEPVIDQPPAFNLDTGTTTPTTPTTPPAETIAATQQSEGLDADGRQREGSGFNQPNIPQPGSFDPVAAQMAAQAAMFANLTKDIMAGQKEAANAMRDGFLSLTEQQQKALNAADEMRKNTGQSSRKPNYSLSQKSNASRNRGGITSTMLTGVGGIATGDLPLGKTNLLGA